LPNPPQPDLFAASLDGFAPLNGNGPRLWVRRLVIWRQRDEVPIRDIALRPGLNIVWSPDGDATGSPMGHGGGKTSFCRLIRYCLGEDSFGTDAQRQRIANARPDAHVGAEVMLDGALWNVIRPIGAGTGTGSHCAVQGGSLETLVQGEMPNPTMAPLRQAIANAIMPTAASHMPGTSSLDHAWEAALAWMTRDQECRLLDILEWRAAETQSRSPSRNMSKPDRLKVVRLLIKALQQDEIDATQRAQGHKRKAEEAGQRKQRVEWLRRDVARNLNEIFGGDLEDDAAPELWASKAKAAASAEKLRADPQVAQKLKDARALVETKDGELRAVEKRLDFIDGAIPEIKETIRLIESQIPRQTLKAQDASDPLCPTCLQKIPPEAQTVIDQLNAALAASVKSKTDAESRQTALLAEEQAAKANAALVRQQLDGAKSTLAALERDAKSAEDALASASGYVTLTTRYPEYLTEIARHDKEMQRELAAEAAERCKADEVRNSAQTIVQRLSELFHMTIQFLVPEGAEGRVLLTESGIQPTIGLHGDLTTAAVDSLKVVAFDQATLLLTMEGKTELPGFWLHDSPREADLGLVIYHRLFELVHWLEGRTDTPQFQYIVTTTTAPPEKLAGEPWRILELSSAPAEKRLFAMDL
jgi:hypothetical protein